MKSTKSFGGILSHGIPEFRLDASLLEKTIDKILGLGIKVKYQKRLGSDVTLTELQNKYDAIFIAIGSNVPMKMKIEGEELQGVYGGNQLLEENAHPNYKGKKVAVIGGGNVAMDCARTIKRKGAEEVYIVYRRAEEQMPAEKKEIEEAKEEGIQFLFQQNIVKILPREDSCEVGSIECIKTELIQKPGELRLSPVDIKGSNYEMKMDYVVMAIGSKPERKVLEREVIEKSEKGYIEVDKDYMTSQKGIFAGGDIIGTKATVAWAARAGRNAAEAIDSYLAQH